MLSTLLASSGTWDIMNNSTSCPATKPSVTSWVWNPTGNILPANPSIVSWTGDGKLKWMTIKCNYYNSGYYCHIERKDELILLALYMNKLIINPFSKFTFWDDLFEVDHLQSNSMKHEELDLSNELLLGRFTKGRALIKGKSWKRQLSKSFTVIIPPLLIVINYSFSLQSTQRHRFLRN